MKKNRGTLIAVVVLLLVSVYFLFFKNTWSTLGEKDNQFAVLDTASITKITMEDRNKNAVMLTRVNAGQWKVDGRYFVRPDAINTLLYTMKMVTVKSLIDQGIWDKVVKGLASNSVKVDIYKGDDKIKSYFVGSQTNDHMGTYMLLVKPHTDENYKQPYVTYIPGFDGFLTTRYFVMEEGWRDRTVFHYYPNEIKSISINYPDPEHSFIITTVAKNKFTIENPVTHQSLVRFDTTAVKQYMTYFQSINWEVVVKPEKRDSIIASPPICVMEVKDTAGKTTNIRLYNRKAPDNVENKYAGKDYKYDPDRLYALVNGKDFVLIQYFVFGKLLQDPSYFVHKD